MILAATSQSASTANQHFTILCILITAGLGAIGYLVRRALNRADERYDGLVTSMTSTNEKLGEVAEGLANVVGQLTAYNDRHEKRWFH